MIKGFKEFIMRGSVVDLAVGVVVGAAFNSIINALVKDILSPLIGVIANTEDFSGLSFTIRNSRFLYGDFLNALISFLLILAGTYFFVVLPMNALAARLKKGETI